MDSRAAKLALARKKLKDHQVKKTTPTQKEETLIIPEANPADHENQTVTEHVLPVVSSNPSSYNIEEKHHIIHNVVETHSNKQNVQASEIDVNVTEILISQKRNLELQNSELQKKLNEFENQYAVVINNYNACEQKNQYLESELKNLIDKSKVVADELILKDKKIDELHAIESSLSDKYNNLSEQLEFTKTMLTAKETENSSLHSQLSNLQNQLDVTKLQLQQLTNGINAEMTFKTENSQQNEVVLQKIATLEQQLKMSQKEKEQISMHYEHYVNDLNQQLKSSMMKNDDMLKEIQVLSNREASLIEQISEMEIRMQNYKVNQEVVENVTKTNVNELEKNYINLQTTLQELNMKYEEVQIKYMESEAKIKELSETKESEYQHDNISIMKLNADIASDKIAAQRATEQNKKLKNDMQNLEEAYVKMSSDKLELTEKLAAEKYLNRELTIKLAEIDEKSKEMHIKLMAKDEEMIRLQTTYRSLEQEYEKLSDQIRKADVNSNQSLPSDNNNEALTDNVEIINKENVNVCTHNHSHHDEEHHLIDADATNRKTILNNPKEDAMLKLQERFLKIMGEVADLSDEKHRLEHIIMQLQNETDTICEYVALYQQQRSLLKKRDEERSAQIKMFQEECDKLKNQIEELSNILTKFAEDQELSLYFKNDSKRNELQKVIHLLSHLKENCLIDPKKTKVDFKNFYPCNCCSGKLIEV